MTTWVVSRHAAVHDWLLKLNIAVDKQVTHFTDVNQLQRGDVVIGNLPVHLIAKLSERDITFFNVELNLPDSLRGRELSEQQMLDCNVKLLEYRATRLDDEDPLNVLQRRRYGQFATPSGGSS